MTARNKFTLLAARALLMVPFLVCGFAAGELYTRYVQRDFTPPFNPCYVFDPQLHHRYRPGCRSVAGPPGAAVEYSFNEDGLRDRPRDAFAGGALVALGDSIGEGLFLHDEDTIPRRLEALLPAGSPKVLNAGVRFSSPTPEYLLYRKLVEPHYPVRGVLWLLNGTDPTDERFFRAMAAETDADGFPTTFPWLGGQSRLGLWLTRVNQWNAGRSELVNALARSEMFRSYRRVLARVPATRASLCAGMFRLAARLRATGVPLAIVFTPHPADGIELTWAGEPFRPQELATLVSCARETGASVTDLSGTPLRPEWFGADHVHYTSAGAAWIAGKILPALRQLAASAPRGNPRRDR